MNLEVNDIRHTEMVESQLFIFHDRMIELTLSSHLPRILSFIRRSAVFVNHIFRCVVLLAANNSVNNLDFYF